MTYGGEPTNSTSVLEGVRDPRLRGYLVDHSVPWDAIDLPRVTALPVAPKDRTEVIYEADLTNGVLWRFVYLANAPSAYRWAFLGGPPMFDEGTGGTTSSTTYVDNGGATLTLPLAGLYWIEHSCHVGLADGEQCFQSVYLGTTALDADADFLFASGANVDGSIVRRIPRVLATAGAVVKTQNRMAAGGPRAFSLMSLNVTPVRVI